MRLFLAIALAQDVSKTLLSYQPAVAEGIRLVDKGQLHLTLHFLGDEEPKKIEAALAKLQFTAFTIELEGVGTFKGGRGSSVLWAGVRLSDALVDLYEQLGTLLAEAGILLKPQRYRPHITLARCKKAYGEENVRRFLQTKTKLLENSVDSFQLYASVRDDPGSDSATPHYKVLSQYK